MDSFKDLTLNQIMTALNMSDNDVQSIIEAAEHRMEKFGLNKKINLHPTIKKLDLTFFLAKKVHTSDLKELISRCEPIIEERYPHVDLDEPSEHFYNYVFLRMQLGETFEEALEHEFADLRYK